MQKLYSKYLTMKGEGAEPIPIKDIGTVALQTDADPDCEVTLQNVTIVGVLHLDTLRACLNCKGQVEPQTPLLGKCSRSDCRMMQRYNLCTENTVGKLMLIMKVTVSINILLKAPGVKSVTIIK